MRAVQYLKAMFAALSKYRFLLLSEGASLLSFQLGDRIVGFGFPLVTQPLKEH